MSYLSKQDINRRSEEGFPASVLGHTVSLLSPHLIAEWDLAESEPVREAKLVPEPESEFDSVLGERCRGRPECNSAASVSRETTLLSGKIKEIQDQAIPSQVKAKYTDEYPALTVEGMRSLIARYNQQDVDKWLHESIVIETVVQKRKNTVTSITRVKLEVESTYRFLVDLVQTFVLYGYVAERSDLLTRLHHVLFRWCQMLKELNGSFLKLAKYKVASFAAYAKKSEVMPKSPFTEEFIKQHVHARSEFIFDGKFLHFWKKCVNNGSLTENLYQMSFIDSICRGVKKGSDRPTDEEVHKANLATVECFARRTEYDDMPSYMWLDPRGLELIGEEGYLVPRWEVRPDSYLNNEDMHYQVRRTVDEIIPPGSGSDYNPSWKHMPSLSASFENNFANGGSMVVVKQKLDSVGFGLEPIHVKSRHGMLDSPEPDQLEPQDANFYAKPLLVEKDGSHRMATPYLEISTNYDRVMDIDISALFRELAQRYKGGDLPKMTVVGLKEALKIRGITKGEALEGWLLKPLQKYLAKKLLAVPCFKVTGGPLKAEYLDDIFTDVAFDEQFLSGDYDNATNEMFSCYTETAIQRICENLGLDEDVTTVATYSLVANLVIYRYRCSLTGKIVSKQAQQRHAQPMGKVLSFVILCIVNASVCRRAKEIDSGRSIKLRNFRALINGDDCCFTLRRIEHWEKCAAVVGLKNSIGKTFFSRSFIEMNSRSFIIDLEHPSTVYLPNGDRLGLRFIETPFVSFGLLKGMIRSSGADTSSVRFERIGCLGDCHQKLIEGCPALYKELDFLFKRYNRDLLEDSNLSGIPYYVPKWLGGLGLHPGPDPREKIPVGLRKQCFYLYQGMQSGKSEHGRIQLVSNLKTCLVHDEILRLQKDLLESNGISSMEVQLSELQLESGATVDLAEENQLVYSELMERAWKTLPIQKIKTDIDDGELEVTSLVKRLEIELSRRIDSKSTLQIALNARHIKKRLRNNSKVWRNSFYMQENKFIPPIPWFQLWHQKKRGFLPLVSMNRLRSERYYGNSEHD
jgi:hypothetical protein